MLGAGLQSHRTPHAHSPSRGARGQGWSGTSSLPGSGGLWRGQLWLELSLCCLLLSFNCADPVLRNGVVSASGDPRVSPLVPCQTGLTGDSRELFRCGLSRGISTSQVTSDGHSYIWVQSPPGMCLQPLKFHATLAGRCVQSHTCASSALSWILWGPCEHNFTALWLPGVVVGVDLSLAHTESHPSSHVVLF